ncbi:LptM family lipoprotein [Streptococcus suis]|uniref:LptM family lipoprotein n=1 Tax=Streptococcus suis TaxID=1307 RepID=UPI001ABEA341|nr:hypothetical protein [Streptococcus suis]MBO4108809.1 hypothetical protein [Streptococcus suis]MDG3136404.1 hypothetical protein [Streptococcus suis]HEM3641175.1 hypothetical protein [Streptococcus suis]
MKVKKWIRLVVALGLALTLVACGQKSTEEIIKTELKDTYVGYSENSGYENPFEAGGDSLTFNKSENSITNSQGDMKYFAVVADEDIPATTRGVITSLESELEGTNNFTVIISREKSPTIKQAEAAYQIALSEGGNRIRIFELRRDSRDYGYYDFVGQAE